MAEIARTVGGKPIGARFADEARVDQKNTITRRWTKCGLRPSAPKDQRTASAYIFGAICPVRGTGAGLVMPRCTPEAMALHLEEIAQAVAPGAHAVLLLDQAGVDATERVADRGHRRDASGIVGNTGRSAGGGGARQTHRSASGCTIPMPIRALTSPSPARP